MAVLGDRVRGGQCSGDGLTAPETAASAGCCGRSRGEAAPKRHPSVFVIFASETSLVTSLSIFENHCSSQRALCVSRSCLASRTAKVPGAELRTPLATSRTCVNLFHSHPEPRRQQAEKTKINQAGCARYRHTCCCVVPSMASLFCRRQRLHDTSMPVQSSLKRCKGIPPSDACT